MGNTTVSFAITKDLEVLKTGPSRNDWDIEYLRFFHVLCQLGYLLYSAADQHGLNFCADFFL